MHMSEETKRMKQHIVPKAHLERFECDGKLTVHRFDEGKNVKTYTSSATKECRVENFYDNDPYAKTSVERSLKRMEDECQKEIDKLHETNIFNTDGKILVKYVSMLMNRSPPLRGISERMARTGTSFGADGKMTHSIPILASSERIMFNKLEDMACVNSQSLTQSFITADMPVAVLPLHEPLNMPPHVKNIVDHMHDPRLYNDKELMNNLDKFFEISYKYTVFICPLSKSQCLFVHRKDYKNFVFEFFGRFGPDITPFVNKLMIESSFGKIYSGTDISADVSATLQSMRPFSEEKKEFMREMDRIQRESRN